MGLLISTFSLAAMLMAPVGGFISLAGAKFSILFGAFLVLCGAIYLWRILAAYKKSEVDKPTTTPAMH